MGTGGSSSKRKSSSSLNKKRSKNSSQVRRRKISRSRSRRNKSKKLRRRDDSVSYSDNHSRSLVSVSSSSSEDGYRRRGSRSRTRKDVRVSKKKARRSSSSCESIQDSPRVKKRKGSKRKADLGTRKKTHKKRRRDASISSMSSGSRSCSTCRDGSSSSEESEYEKPRGRSERKERDKRDIGKGKSGTKRSRYRSLSCSSCSRRSKGNSYQSEEKWTGENNTRRLKSVITVAKEPDEKEERELDKDWHKEEIVYDHDDYPSCRSNDSNDGESKRELAHNSHVTFEKKRWIENVKGEETSVSNIITSEVMEKENDGGGRYDGSNPSFDGDEANDYFKENKCEVSAAIGSPTSDDLETILRQRALENLRKFRGGLHTIADQKEKSDNDMKQLSTAKAESVQIKSHKEDGARVVSATQVVDRISMPRTGRNSAGSSQNDGKVPDGEYSKTEFGADKSVQIKSHKEDGARVVSATQVVDQISMPTTGRNSARSSRNDGKVLDGEYSKTEFGADKLVQIKSHKEDGARFVTSTQVVDQISVPTIGRNSTSSSRNDGKIPEGKYSGTESGATKINVIRPPNQLAIAGNPKEKDSIVTGAIIDKSKLVTSALRREPSGTFSTPKQVPTSQASPKAKLLVTKSVDKSATETAQTVSRSGNNNGENVNNACGSASPEPPSCLEPTSGEQSSKEPQGEAKDGSQFEQKTMSVMRGGEMVQVSYKVYIPKKAPALARRQLRR